MNWMAVNAGANALSLFRGLGEPYIQSYTPAGTVIEWGGNPYHLQGSTSLNLEEMRVIANSLLATGLYADVTAIKLAGVFNPYYVLRLVTGIDRAALVDVYSDIEDAFRIAKVEPASQQFYVKSFPSAASGQPGIVTVNAGAAPGDGQVAYTRPLPATNNAVDALANWLGVSPTQAVVVGAIGAIAALVLIKRVV